MDVKKEYDIDVDGIIDSAMAVVAKYQGLDVKTVTIGELTARWFELKKVIDEVDTALKQIKNIQSAIEPEIIAEMEAMDIDKLSSKFGTMSLSTKMYATAKDFNAFMHWVSEDLDDRIGFVTKKIADVAVNEMFQESGELPPGVDTYIKTTLSKRKK
jgi:hypothetical protein